MTHITIYHHPRCSKSRAACELIAARGVEATVIDYLTNPPSRAVLRPTRSLAWMAVVPS